MPTKRDAYIIPFSVVGIPKTIDNDIMFTDKSFGYQTACGAAVEAIKLRMRKRVPSPMGSGLFKLTGRHSGFIVCSAAPAASELNFVLL